jgi:molybdopterin synthase catalytic subunit
MSSGADVLRLVAVRDGPLSVDEVLAAVRDEAAGGTVVFLGSVRREDGGRGVRRLGYSAHPSVLDAMRAIAGRVAGGHPVRALAAVHRVGELAVGDLAVVVAVACPHRGEAFAACRELVDEIKHEIPVWKHQVFTDGGEEWVGSA